MFTIEEKVEMFKMRNEGYTFQEIADKYNVTRQCVFTILNCRRKMKKAAPVEACIFPNLKKWLTNSELSFTQFCNKVGRTYPAMSGKLSGKKELKKSEIDAICKVCNIPYEVLFSMEEEKNESV